MLPRAHATAIHRTGVGLLPTVVSTAGLVFGPGRRAATSIPAPPSDPAAYCLISRLVRSTADDAFEIGQYAVVDPR